MSVNVVFCGEAWGEHEATIGTPFVGPAGVELYRLLHEVGFPIQPLRKNTISPHSMSRIWAEAQQSSSIKLLNTFNAHPEGNNVELFYGTRKDPVDSSLPWRQFGSSRKWVRNDRGGDVRKLLDDLHQLRPNLIVPLGATATWALGLGSAITKLRGFVHTHALGKVLATYHPAAVLRNWSLRVPTLFDLYKAKRESTFSQIRRVEREVWTQPTIADLWAWWDTYGQHAPLLALDIETLKGVQVSEVGFAADPHHALHIPFCWRDGGTYRSWWPDTKTEAEAWKFVRHVCASPIPKIGQQGHTYDCYMLAKCMGIVVNNYHHDTMQASHAWLPELGKSLYDLGSIFLDEMSWKSIRKDIGKDSG